MAGKKDKQFLFEVQLNWLMGTKGILTAKGVKGSIHLATPLIFGGEVKQWTAEQLFLSSLSGSFMSTYLLFAKKIGFAIDGFECNTIGKIEVIDGKYRFTKIDLYPKIFLTGEELRQKAKTALAKTHKHCLIINSLSSTVFYHSELLVTPAERGSEYLNHK